MQHHGLNERYGLHGLLSEQDFNDLIDLQDYEINT
jgi:hypothetical protein